MQTPLEVHFHNVDQSSALEARVRELAARLERYSAQIVHCRIHAADLAYRDPYVTLRDAFSAARRQLQEYERRRRGDVKTHVFQGERTSDEAPVRSAS